MSRDLRKYAQDTSIQLGVGAFLLLFIVGDGLIYLIYGKGAAMMGLLCLLAGVAPVVVIAVFMILLNWIVKRANRD
ncbi:MAG: hypothetical protein HN736_19355 [Anaerolineae bacterium]|jgi:hypothetical protein|nr:hypothetical protein [Anaerolineae bacterium]MBT4311719.1 hypothetical protein [Anaerolineae bacterium]MBT4459128.1 hypothetical protein [Anaerolineae bacterium]MBT4840909.1 hypothetical protein [Anaerolineae bacterium]MBT6060721.1 hypothetical protein [Anaerolineae bacterium]